MTGIFIKSVVGTFTNTFIVSAIAGVIGLAIAFMIKERKAGEPVTDKPAMVSAED